MSSLFPPSFSESHIEHILAAEARKQSFAIAEKAKTELGKIAEELKVKESDSDVLEYRFLRLSIKKVEATFLEFKQSFLANYADLEGNPRRERIKEIAEVVVYHQKRKFYNADLEESFQAYMEKIAAEGLSSSGSS